jgi:hypothetical protein
MHYIIQKCLRSLLSCYANLMIDRPANLNGLQITNWTTCINYESELSSFTWRQIRTIWKCLDGYHMVHVHRICPSNIFLRENIQIIINQRNDFFHQATSHILAQMLWISYSCTPNTWKGHFRHGDHKKKQLIWFGKQSRRSYCLK